MVVVLIIGLVFLVGIAIAIAPIISLIFSAVGFFDSVLNNPIFIYGSSIVLVYGLGLLTKVLPPLKEIPKLMKK